MSDAARSALETAFRRLSPQLVAALGRRVGPGRLDLAEDAVQFAMLQAARTWPFHGAPDQPRAWLLRVASNRLVDLLQLRSREAPSEDAGSEASGPVEAAPEPPAFAAELPDDELRLLFACCHPALSEEVQVTLTLKVACGFSVREIALALLADEPAVAQRLVRAKRTLRERCAALEVPGNEGYEASGGEDLSRVELCEEALRLVELLLSHPRTATHEGQALAALFCFSAARLPGRVDAEGTFVPLAARGPGDPGRRSRPWRRFARSPRWSATRGASPWRGRCGNSSASGGGRRIASDRPRRWPGLRRSGSSSWRGLALSLPLPSPATESNCGGACATRRSPAGRRLESGSWACSRSDSC